jgi:predicted dehydrogenase
MAQALKIGVVGAGRGLGFSAVCRHLRGVATHALCDLDLDYARSVQEQAGFRYVFDDFETFLASGIDIAVIASPPPFHVQQAVAALKAGIHVLSEVPAAHTINECFELLQAVRGSQAQYMLAENYRYTTEVELVRRMAADGCFGELYYAECAYIHDCRPIRRERSGRLSWRAYYPAQILYSTHSLAPVNYWWAGCRITTAISQDTGGNRFEPGQRINDCDVALLRNEALGLIVLRVDGNSPRPHNMAQYHLQGTWGAYESGRGGGDPARVYLTADGKTNPDACWEPLSNYAAQYLPEEWLNPPPEAHAGGHGTSEWFMIRDFLDAVRNHSAPPIDVLAALNCSAPGLYALSSRLQGGIPVAIPDYRAMAMAAAGPCEGKNRGAEHVTEAQA